MRTFTDNMGRQWQVSVTVPSIKRVRDLLGIDLLNHEDGAVFKRLIGDPVALVDVIYVLCKPQCDKANVTDQDFGAALVGDAIDHATRALLEDLTDFFPSARDRANVARVMEAMNETMERARDLIEAQLPTQIQKLQQKALAMVEERISGSTSGNSAASPDALPQPKSP